MRPTTHLATSVLLALAVYPRRPREAALLVAAGVLIDVDHLVMYGLNTGDWSVSGALVYNRYRSRALLPGDARPRYGTLRSWIHRPLLMAPLLGWLALRCAPLRPALYGILAHLLLDHIAAPREWLAWWRAGRRCIRCGRRQRLVVVRLRSGQPADRPAATPFTVLCKACYYLHSSGRQ